ncbi:hypothetical protein N0V93_009646 [Gnomoniopsis smithogilvyi]|uniref:CENP-T/Histone H4 histone fold domain-containing protein n=1 Tax=Gnomoniopsis smithogilvyi TaxID=1191159 RepID=A0A9W8YMF3_9PEZI|nr:hypothetical protein N0V93_009646 [Gnomoniopsis smithogilvyi]
MSTPGRPQRSPSKTSATPRRSSSHPPKHPHKQDDNLPVRTPDNAPDFRASAPPTSITRFSIRTPGSQILPDFRRSNLLTASVGRSGGAKSGYGTAAPTQFTPHGRAAIRALDSRRAAINDINTPGRNRRRSMRDQRETPRDILRALSKTLAPKSKTISSTSSSSSPGDDPTVGGARVRGRIGGRRGRRGQVVIPENPEDSDDEFPIDRPRFSLPIDEDVDSDDDLPRPPRSSGLEDLEDNYTMQSIEMPRRATIGLSQGRHSMRMSMGDLQSEDGGDGGFDSAFFPRVNWDEDTGERAGGEDDATLERVDDEGGRRDTTLGGRISDFGAIDFTLDAGDQSTVVMAPQVESSPERGSFSPENEPFGFDDEPPPADEDMDVDNVPLDFGADDNDDDERIELGDVTTESVVARHMPKAARQGRVMKPGKKTSRHGIEYPSLPSNVVKRLAQRFAGKTKISPDTLNAIMQASDWFFEQLGDDLRAYANHAKGRTTINESDMLTLMRRQRQTSASATPFALAQKHLPRELVQELRMPAPAPVKKRQRRVNAQADDEEVT